MQSSSADTQYTFGDNIVAVAESGGHQSSPATGEESGAASGTWHNLSSRRSRSSASQRQTGRTSRRSTPRDEQGLEHRRDLLHDQELQDLHQIAIQGPETYLGKGGLVVPNISPLIKQLVRNCWSIKGNSMKN